MPGWTGSHSQGFGPTLRWQILQRDPICCCQACALHPGRCVQRSTKADHIIPVAEGGTNHPTNGQGLCARCHDTKTQAEAARGRARRNPKRQPEPHPGLR